MNGGRVGLVLAGGGARGAYEIGALSELLPVLEERQELPSVIVGTSVGALNAAFLAAQADLPADAVMERCRETWRSIRWEDVIRSLWSPWTFVPALRYTAGLFSRRVRVESLLDSRPLAATLKRLIPIERLQANISSGRLHAAGVVATRVGTGRSVVFYAGGPDRIGPDEFRGIEYVRGELEHDHVRASAAFPAVFRPVEVADWWYVDGGVRLNTPIKPALKLGADRMVVVALNTTRVTEPAAGLPWPDVFDGGGQIMQAILADPLANDVRTLARINDLVAGGHSDAQLVPYILIAPSVRDRIGAIAREVFANRPPLLSSVGAMGRLLHADATNGSGELFSHLFFVREFAEALFAEGARDARGWLSDKHDDEIWQHGPLTPT